MVKPSMMKKNDAPLILILADGLPNGGTERQIVELLKGLQEFSEVRTAIGVLQKGGAREQEAFTYADMMMPIRQNRSLDFTMALSLIPLIKNYRVDLIHTFGAVSDLCGLVAGKIVGVPIINGSIRSARPQLNRRDRFSRMTMRFADRIVANSAAGLKAFGIETWPQAQVIRNGVDLSRFNPVPAAQRDPFSICMVGNFTGKKDQAALIAALPDVLQRFPETHLTLVGSGARLSECKALTGRLGLDTYVSFISDCNEPERIIGSCSIGALLSPGGEGISNVLLEYMAMELPVIATDRGGNREVFEDGTSGMLVADHRPSTLNEAICSLFENPVRAAEMGIQGRRRVQETFVMERMVADYRQLYRDVLGIDCQQVSE